MAKTTWAQPDDVRVILRKAVPQTSWTDEKILPFIEQAEAGLIDLMDPLLEELGLPMDTLVGWQTLGDSETAPGGLIEVSATQAAAKILNASPAAKNLARDVLPRLRKDVGEFFEKLSSGERGLYDAESKISYCIEASVESHKSQDTDSPFGYPDFNY